jgi:hypothetical protein
MSSLAIEIQTARAQASRQWAEIVHAAATGNEPSLAALAKVAAVLGLTTDQAHAKLHADVDLVNQHRQQTAARDTAKFQLAEVLAANGGSVAALQEAIATTEAHARKLRETLNWCDHGLAWAMGAAEGTLARLEASRPDLFA